MSNELLLKKFENQLKEIHQAAFYWALTCASYDQYLAEEVLQESYYKALSKFEQYDESRPLKAWFFTIIRNTSTDLFRKKNRTYENNEKFQQQAKLYKTSTQLSRVQNEKDRLTFLGYLEKLSKREREVIDLVYYQQMTIKQAAEIMNIKQGSAAGYLKKAKSALKDIILTPVQPEAGTPAFDKTWTCGLEKFSRKKAA